MQEKILAKLKELREQFPDCFSKPVDVLPDVHNDIDGEWEQRLKQANDSQIGERTVLIPYQVTDDHWIGICLKFKNNEQIEHAEFIDPLKSSEFNPSRVQRQFTKIHPNIVLKARELQNTDDPKQTAELTVDNLLEAAEEVDHSDFEIVSTSQSPSSQLHENNSFLPEEPVVVPENNPEITTEMIQNMHQDYSSMPSCAERSIICLLYYLTSQPDDIETKIQKEFESLKERIKLEELNFSKNDQSMAYVLTNIKNKNWPCAMTELKKLLKRIRPLDMHEVLRLVEKVNDAANQVRDQRIILFLGRTGSGKSTTIHFLAGSKMIQTTIDGRTHITPTAIKNAALDNVICSVKTRSETRYITPVPVNYRDVDGYNRGSIILCDSPGFGDTSGPEVDIANGIGIIRAIKGCQHVKPVVLFSYKSIGDKCEGVKQLAHLLSGLIPNIRDYIETFTYIFTKYPDAERKEIHASLKAVNDELNEDDDSDIGFVGVLHDMLIKTKKNAQTLDPLNDEPGPILDELGKSQGIDRPDEVFELSLTEETKHVIKEQLRQYQSSITSAIQRSDYALVKYILDQLKSLNDLLQKDHIEQVYHECIRQITRHLSTEYDTTIAMFDRCFINETSLQIEDIQQYQTCLSHFKLVDELRTGHFGQEVVRSSALISHLKQQIQILSTNLKTKDISDTHVKVGLDKLRLISKLFPDFHATYQELCQLFSTKIDFIVQSFKQSVVANQFDESADCMNRLSNARMNLQEHFDDTDMFAKYAELQTYLLQHLDDTIRKLTPVLTKDKLEQVDIDRLDTCLCMLSSAMKTSAFEPHISIANIKNIYDDFLFQVLNYVEKIVQRIDSELNNENSLDVLEQYMQQFDLIRTIAMIRDQTIESYLNTVGKLVDYIRESQRIVDGLLDKLFRRETRINYDQLVKSLTSLKGAQWIEKYRQGVYSDMIKTVEQQFIEHIQTLRESLMEINLDLDHWEKLKQVYESVLEVNQMKKIEKIIGDISESINVINSWFAEQINHVFATVKDTFNIQQCNAQTPPKLDFDEAEKAISYLNICKNCRSFIRNDCAATLTNLEKFIRYYSDFIGTEMENCFEFIIEFHGGNKAELSEKARIIAKHIHELSDIQTNYRQVFSYFGNKRLVQDWKHKLTENLNELADQMTELTYTSRIEELNHKLLIAKTLSRLDSFLDGSKYLDLYDEYRRKLQSQTNDIQQQVLDAIDRHEYDRVASEMAVLQSSSGQGEQFYKQAKRALTNGLNKLMDETRNQAIMLIYRIELEEVRSIVDNLRRLQRANQFVCQLVDTADEIGKCISEVKQLIEEQIKRILDGIKGLITINNFAEADKKIDSITLVAKTLDNFCTTNISQQIVELRALQKKVVLQDVVEKYSEMDFQGYTLNPPSEIFTKFSEVNNTNPIYYQALNSIKANILNKFRNELQLAKVQMPPSLENVHLRRFESNIRHLPDAMRHDLELDLQHCKADITANIRDNRTRLESTLKSNDLNSMETALKEYQRSPRMKSYADPIKDTIRKQIQELSRTIVRNFDEYEIVEALNNVKKLYVYKTKFERLVDGTEQLYATVHARSRTAFQDAYSCLNHRFLKNHYAEMSTDAIGKVERSFVCFMEFIRFSTNTNEKTIVIHILPEDFQDTITKWNKTTTEDLTNLQTKNDEALEKLDAISLKNSLDLLYRWNSLITKMKQYDNVYLKSYSQLLTMICNRIEELRRELLAQDIINSKTKEYEKERTEFYRKLNEKFSFIQKAHVIFETFEQINIDLHQIEQECIESLKQKIFQIIASAKAAIEIILSDPMSIGHYSKDFNLYYHNLLSFQQEMQIKGVEINDKIAELQKRVALRIEAWKPSASAETNIGTIAKNLINMKRISNHLPAFSKHIKQQIDETLQHYKSRTTSPINLGKLAVVLQQDETGIGSSIVTEHKAFESFVISVFVEKTKRHGIEYVLDDITGDTIDKTLLRKRYDEFQSTYQNLIRQNLKTDIKLDGIISDTLLISGNIKVDSNSPSWNATLRAKIPTIAAHVFALWTLRNAHNYFDAAGVDNQDSYLLQPHAAQTIAIFRMLGIGDKTERLENNLVQLGTGEGKSITLGATAAILALLGFEVRCACYSEYLSKRDYDAFQPLFDSLGLVEYIHYGTFNKLCEAMINENGNIRQRVENFILKDSSKRNSGVVQQTKRPKILLIDEVDVFFSRDFYGHVYSPSANLRDPTITALIGLIWKERNSKLSFRNVETRQEYQACCRRFPNWKLLIDQAVKDLLLDVSSFQSHDYVVKQDKIGYIEQDNIVYNVKYGYKTLFAYYYEYEKGSISQESLEENIGINLKCGSFSYAEVPLKFAYIMGVTGTLKTLSEPERRVIQNDYKIRRSTFTPSVFGENNPRFVPKDDIKLEDDLNYFNTIRREIDDQLIGRKNEKRAVLVVFESIQKLKDFYESKALEPIKSAVSYLTEEASAEEKEHLVKRATASGQIMLLTRTFGRGTDFVCHDQRVSASGGVHVIQTFLSEELSEEIQIRGRTARQGDHGSYSLILNYRDLEKFHIRKEDITDIKTGKGILLRLASAISRTKRYDSIYDFLDDKRADLFRMQYEDNMKYVVQAKKRHLATQEFLDDLNAGNIDAVRTFLVGENRGVEGCAESRTICLMDATSSMTHLLHKCKTKVDDMVQRASEILKEYGINPNSFQIQFVVYRNYNSREEKLLQSSPWETRPDNLRAFMNTIEVSGGWGNEAIEVGLWHANKEKERERITQVILIGDAPPNTSEEVKTKREYCGEDYWKGTKFAQATYYEDELAILQADDIPIHAFYVEEKAEAAFRSIASATNGRCEKLDINSASGSDMLTDFITEEILRNRGGDSRGNDLVEAYRKRFGKVYT